MLGRLVGHRADGHAHLSRLLRIPLVNGCQSPGDLHDPACNRVIVYVRIRDRKVVKQVEREADLNYSTGIQSRTIDDKIPRT